MNEPHIDFAADAAALAAELARSLERSAAGEGAVVELTPLARLADELRLRDNLRDGGLTGARFVEWARTYLERTTHLAHPRSLAHQVAVPHPAGALGALLGAATNNPMAIYEMGPAAAAIEFGVLNWMLEKIGWTPPPLPPGAAPDSDRHGGGVFTHGGSLANLTALIAARTAVAPEVWAEGNPGDLALVVSAESHYSITRATGVLGLGSRSVYPVEVGPNATVRPEGVEHALARVAAEGKRPIAVVVNACNTAAGTFDPLRRIGEICRARGVWLHVDGAHGASALLSPTLRFLLDGIELADSVVWDAHKLLRVPGLATALLVRRAATLDRAFQQDASYLFHEKEQPGFDFVHRTVECTKAGLGLRTFAVLAALGERGLAAYVERQFALAREAHALLSAREWIECPVVPESNILCFRIQGSDDLQLTARDELLRRGSFHLSTAVLGGRRCLRAVFMAPATTLADVAALADELEGIARRLRATPGSSSSEVQQPNTRPPGSCPPAIDDP